MGVKLQIAKELYQLVNGHSHHFGDVLATNFYIQSLLFEAAATAGIASCLARVSRLHHAELNLATLALDIVEEGVESVKILITCPEQLLLLGGKGVIWLVYGEAEEVGIFDELLFPLLHRGATPADDGVLVYCLALVGNNQVGINTHRLAVALAYGAGTNGVVEAEEVLRRLLELYTVSFEASRKLALVVVDNHAAHIFAIAVSS